MAPECRLAEDRERAVYELHENSESDPGYRRFLTKLAEPLLARMEAGACGLDFGCGPGPALAKMLEEAGLAVALYDPFFYPDDRLLTQRYDFVTCTEVVEHLYQPAEVFQMLDRLLRRHPVVARLFSRLSIPVTRFINSSQPPPVSGLPHPIRQLNPD